MARLTLEEEHNAVEEIWTQWSLMEDGKADVTNCKAYLQSLPTTDLINWQSNNIAIEAIHSLVINRIEKIYRTPGLKYELELTHWQDFLSGGSPQLETGFLDFVMDYASVTHHMSDLARFEADQRLGKLAECLIRIQQLLEEMQELQICLTEGAIEELKGDTADRCIELMRKYLARELRAGKVEWQESSNEYVFHEGIPYLMARRIRFRVPRFEWWQVQRRGNG